LIWKILAGGRPAPGFAREGIRDDLARIQGFTKIEPQKYKFRGLLRVGIRKFRAWFQSPTKGFSTRQVAGNMPSC
jgi:hypothetical protein